MFKKEVTYSDIIEFEDMDDINIVYTTENTITISDNDHYFTFENLEAFEEFSKKLSEFIRKIKKDQNK